MTESAPEATTEAPASAPATTASDTTISDLADAITNTDAPTGSDNRPSDGAILRYGKVTAVGTGTNLGKAQTDTTGAFWAACDSSYLPAVGDLVYLFQQGPISHIGGKLGGNPSGPPVGVMHPYAGATAPTGWLLCNGAAVSRTTYAELFAICGTTYGAGDGSTTFNVPNLVDRIPTGSGSLYARGEKGGSETVLLTTSHLPDHAHSHSHVVNPGSHDHSMTHDHASSPHSHSISNGGSEVQRAVGSTATGGAGTGSTGSATSNVTSYSGRTGGANLPAYTTDTDATVSTGGGTAFNNMPPYLGTNWILRALR